MAKTKIISSLDIGTSSVKALIAQKHFDSEQIKILGFAKIPCHGLRRGVVIDIEETIKAIELAKQKAEQSAGLPLEHAFVSLEGSHICSQSVHGTVAVSRADGEVSQDDVSRVVEAAQAVSLPGNCQVLEIIPREFTIDSQKIKNPIGMNGVRLEVDALLIQGLDPFIKNLEKCINQAGVDINAMVVAPLADELAVLSKRQKELGVAVINLGAGTTDLLVYEEASILTVNVLPLGAGHITSDIAIGLKTSIETAEAIKIKYGSALKDKISQNKKIDLSKIDSLEQGFVFQEEIVEIVEARLQEVFSLINLELKKIHREALLPGGVVLVGGGSKIPFITDLAKKVLSLPVQIGIPQGLTGVVESIMDPEYVTAAGLILYGAKEQEQIYSKIGFSKDLSALRKIKQWLRAFLP
ncbi:cell division protein FtsA [bacterium]|nr:cell division protein FtsA [bacterium]